MKEWGVVDPESYRSGLAPEGPQPHAPARQVTMLQRKVTKLGKGLGKTTGWIHRASLTMKSVEMIGGVNYEKIDAKGITCHVIGGADVAAELDAKRAINQGTHLAAIL